MGQFETQTTYDFIATMRTHYIVAMLWANTYDHDDNGQSMTDRTDNLTVWDITDAAALASTVDVATFLAAPIIADKPGAQNVLTTLRELGIAPEQAGHDLALTRNHHGAGFWDRGYPAPYGDLLTAAAEKLGEQSWWVNSDMADVE